MRLIASAFPRRRKRRAAAGHAVPGPPREIVRYLG